MYRAHYIRVLQHARRICLHPIDHPDPLWSFLLLEPLIDNSFELVLPIQFPEHSHTGRKPLHETSKHIPHIVVVVVEVRSKGYIHNTILALSQPLAELGIRSCDWDGVDCDRSAEMQIRWRVDDWVVDLWDRRAYVGDVRVPEIGQWGSTREAVCFSTSSKGFIARTKSHTEDQSDG